MLLSPPSYAYDFSIVKRAPLLRAPSEEDIRRNNKHPLIRALHTEYLELFRLSFLLPEKFRIVDGSLLPQVIEDVVAKIAATEEGKKAICPFGANSEKDIASYFQISRKLALQIQQSCRGIKIPDIMRRHLMAIRHTSLPLFPEPMVRDKKFVFIFTESGRPGVESYTSKTNVTYIILSPETMNETHIFRAFAHELAVSYDQLSSVGYLIDPVHWDQGVGLAFGTHPLQFETFEKKSSGEIQEMKCAIRDPAVRYALTAQRAFRWEDLIVAARGETAASPNVAATGTCGEIVAKNSVLLRALARTVSWETTNYQSLCEKMPSSPEARLKQVIKHIKTIEKIQLKFRDSGKPISLCEFLLEPRVGPHQRDLHAGGPRPRMGGWAERQDSSDMERALRGESLEKEKQNGLGNSLLFPDTSRVYEEEDEKRGRR